MARYFAIIPAGGSGTRFGGDLPKQYQPLGGRTVLEHAVDSLLNETPLARVYVAHAEHDRRCVSLVPQGLRVATLSCGGPTRARTVRNALAALRGTLVDDDWILVHDAARPCLPHDALLRLLREVGDDPVGGLLAIPVADTLKREENVPEATAANRAPATAVTTPQGAPGTGRRVGETVPRSGLWQAQTPQMFRYGLLYDALKSDRAREATDEAQAVEIAGFRPLLVEGSAANLKITWPSDIALAESLLLARRAPARTA